MEMLMVCGYYIGITHTNNLMGHGFYQFSPELIYRVFSEENGFKLKEMFIAVDRKKDFTEWYEVADPMSVKSRVILSNNFPVSLPFLAEKISEKEIFSSVTQQSDYYPNWNEHSSAEKKLSVNKSIKNILPVKLKTFLRRLYNLLFIENHDEILLKCNSKHFIKTEF